jgi:hypothetical protein
LNDCTKKPVSNISIDLLSQEPEEKRAKVKRTSLNHEKRGEQPKEAAEVVAYTAKGIRR